MGLKVLLAFVHAEIDMAGPSFIEFHQLFQVGFIREVSSIHFFLTKLKRSNREAYNNDWFPDHATHFRKF